MGPPLSGSDPAVDGRLSRLVQVYTGVLRQSLSAHAQTIWLTPEAAPPSEAAIAQRVA